jgi:hypothetical protein
VEGSKEEESGVFENSFDVAGLQSRHYMAIQVLDMGAEGHQGL